MTLKVTENQYGRYPSDSWASCFSSCAPMWKRRREREKRKSRDA